MALSNNQIGKKAELFVISHFKRKGIKAWKVKHARGYDIRAGRLVIEVKGTLQTPKQKTHFTLTRNEYAVAKRNSGYRIYWVDLNKKRIYRKITQKRILENVHRASVYRVYLSKIKKRKGRKYYR